MIKVKAHKRKIQNLKVGDKVIIIKGREKGSYGIIKYIDKDPFTDAADYIGVDVPDRAKKGIDRVGTYKINQIMLKL